MSVTSIRASLADRVPRLWALWAASRPSQIALILLVYALGLGMATAGAPLVAGRAERLATGTLPLEALLGAVALVPVSVTIHYANEVADVETDRLTERTPFSGGSGALVETGLPPSFLRRATAVAGFISIATVTALSRTLPLRAVAILITILVAGLAYSLPPVALIRRGVGELVNAVLGGLLLPVFGVAVVASPTALAWLSVLPFALLVGCNLLATHWPDREADGAVGKRTLVVRWSPPRIRRAYVVLATTSLALATLLWLRGIFPDAVALAHVAPVPFLLWGRAVLTRQRSPFPSVLAMVVLAVTSTAAWWWVGIGS